MSGYDILRDEYIKCRRAIESELKTVGNNEFKRALLSLALGYLQEGVTFAQVNIDWNKVK